MSISQNESSVTEGDSHSYTLTLDKPSESDTTVKVQVGSKTTEDGEVEPITQEVVIPAGEMSATFSIDTVDDNIAEGSEDFKVSIISTDNPDVIIDTEHQEVTTSIVDNDTACVSITQDESSVNEGDVQTYTLHLDKPSESDTTVKVVVGHKTTSDGDFEELTKEITIPAGSQEVSFTIETKSDEVVEGSEEFKVSIESVEGANVAIDENQKEVTTTIVDDDKACVSISQDSENIDEGTTNTYTISLDKVSELDTKVTVQISHITTDEGDLHQESRTITIPAGETSAEFQISNIEDNRVESAEAYNVKIINAEAISSDGSEIENKIDIDRSSDEVITIIVDNDVSSHSWGSSNNCWGDDPITVLEDGSYIVPFLATSEVNNADNDGYGVFFQRYDADGNKIGEPELANTTTQGNQFEADVASLSDGGYVLAWQSDVGDGSGNGIYMQRYDADGNRVGEETQVNTTTQGNQEQVAITGLKDGGYVVSWQSDSENGKDIYLQKFDASGERVGGEIVVNQNVEANQVMPSIDTLADGGFVVTWQSDGENGQEVYSRVFDINMNASNEIHINTSLDGDQTLPSISGLEDGSFVITWISHDGDKASINLQRFDTEGNPIGDEKVVSELSDFDNYSNVTPEVAGLKDGGFVVVFADKDSDGSGVYYQRYDANGEEIGDRVLINQDEDANQYNPHITQLNDGGFLTTWVNVSEEQDSMEVVGQRFDANGDRVGEVFKVSEITTDSQVVHDLIDSHEVNTDISIDFEKIDYLDFDGIAQNQDSNNHSSQYENISNEAREISLQDLISDLGENEVDMSGVEATTHNQIEQSQLHQIQPPSVPELNMEVENVDNSSHIIDIQQQQILVDDI